MKKVFAVTSAILATTALTSVAQAADPIKLSVGGYMTQYVAYIDHDDTTTSNYTKVLNGSDTEIHFSGSTKLDNGLTVAVQMDMEADREDGDNNGMDDVFMSVSSDTLGKVELGATTDVVDKMTVAAPVGGVGLGAGDYTLFTNLSGGDDDTAGEMGDDGQKVNYFSPSIAGFQLGLTYGLQAVGNLNNYAPVNTASDAHDYLIAAALGYSGEVAGVSVSADVGHGKVFTGGLVNTANNENSTTTRGGLNLGMAGFTLGGAVGVVNDAGGNSGRAIESWELGGAYATGPYTVSLGYQNVQTLDDGTTNDAEHDLWVAALDYDLGAGVTASLSVFNIDQDKDGTTNDRSALGIVSGISASF